MRSWNSGNEELGTISWGGLVWSKTGYKSEVLDLRVGAGVCHGEEEGAFVLEVEVLVWETFAVDGFSAGAL